MSKRRIVIISLIIILFIICILASILYSNGKYTISFETGSLDKVLNQYVKRGGTVLKPADPKKEGYIFDEWQKDGKTYDFDEKVVEDIILTAKWTKEEYITVDFVDDGNIIETVKILKGSKLNSLMDMDREGYNFLGWYLNDEVYNNIELYEDTKLISKYEKISDMNYNIGDTVIIIGPYARSASSKGANYNKAIGWDRKILKVYENSNYPYMIGNESGVTGYFKEESIKHVN